ncbi:hypothetical protein H0H92_003595 [Tricholoma furcatifolium]|nr:hypothetical protein H0H92_003595 [Tricholoma furcatifolium]
MKKLHLRFPDRWKQKSKWPSHALDISQTTLQALKESSDAIPLLKSVVGAVDQICLIAGRVKSSKKAAKALASQCFTILTDLSDSISDPYNIPPDMEASIKQLEIVLIEIIEAMKPLEKRNGLLHLHRNEDELKNKSELLLEARERFKIASAIRIEEKVSRTDATVHTLSNDMIQIHLFY